MKVSERSARMGLCALAWLGAPAVATAVVEFGAVDVWTGLLARGEETVWGRRAAAVDLVGIQRATEALQARFIIPTDPEWPQGLANLATADVAGQSGEPTGLWVLGRSLQELDGGVAIVGARASTSYGEQAALLLAADLAVGGRPIVSGLAFGIDAAAHRGALGNRGTTIAVVASGLDNPYPSANRALADAVIRGGALVSELPPGYRPTKHAFLARNRIIAGLSEAVIVVEAASRSGAKNTASWGNALGRHVLAVPGPITSSMSSTPHRLIREGEATLVTSAADVEACLQPVGRVIEPDGRGERRPIDALPAELRELREAIQVREEVTPAQLSQRTGQPRVAVLAGISELVEMGWLEETLTGVRLPTRA